MTTPNRPPAPMHGRRSFVQLAQSRRWPPTQAALAVRRPSTACPFNTVMVTAASPTPAPGSLPTCARNHPYQLQWHTLLRRHPHQAQHHHRLHLGSTREALQGKTCVHPIPRLARLCLCPSRSLQSRPSSAAPDRTADESPNHRGHSPGRPRPHFTCHTPPTLVHHQVLRSRHNPPCSSHRLSCLRLCPTQRLVPPHMRHPHLLVLWHSARLHQKHSTAHLRLSALSQLLLCRHQPSIRPKVPRRQGSCCCRPSSKACRT
ncbi:hypothetical protein BC831DRAFT_447524 [Entophlyctis helioformis]|nr:hypothetical protein BC831DRAFT_447524 [Entophlyctis helioformis]